MEQYLPDSYQQSIYVVDYKKLKERGIKCILFDLDNTLVPYQIKTPPEKLIAFISELKKEFKVVLFSNSPRSRLRPFKENLEVDCLASACKPASFSFLKVLEEYHYTINEVAIIGDQLVTDIIGGNKVGITTILVNPVSTKNPWWTALNRSKEKRIMKRLNDRNLLFKGRYYD